MHRLKLALMGNITRLPGAAPGITPTVLRLIAQHAPRFLNRQESLVWTELSLQHHARENLGQQLRCRPRHNRVGISDDEHVCALEWGFNRSADRLSSVASVDVAPKVPFATVGILVEVRKCGIIVG